MTIEDASRILKIHPAVLTKLPVVRSGDNLYISDQKLGRAWASGAIESPRGTFKKGGITVSFDELIVLTIIEMALPGAKVEMQVPVGKRVADFRVTFGNRSLVVEFLGPYHFIRRSLNQNMTDPRDRAKYIEDVLHEECVIWPYWVQRCSSNALALFDPRIEGIGSIWSTSAHFGDFFFRDSAPLIRTLNSRFRLERSGGVGYMYTDELVAKPVHPIVQRIRNGRDPIQKLIPSGAGGDYKYWLPRSLWPLLV